MKKRNIALIIFITILISSCSQNNNDDQTTVPEQELPLAIINHEKTVKDNAKDDGQNDNNHLKSNIEDIVNHDNNITQNQPINNKVKKNNKSSDKVDDPSDNINKDEKPRIADNPKPPKENIKPNNPTEQDPTIKDNPIVTPPKEEPVKKLCENAWYDEFKDCDYIPDNLKPVDELGRVVPLFNTSQEAWNWGENEIENNKSGYGCRGFTRMDGHYNNGKQFFFAYLKVCDN